MLISNINQLRSIIKSSSDRTFLVDVRTGKSFSYGAINAVTADLTRELTAKGVVKGDRVGMILHNSIEFVCCYLACLCTGAVAVPINVALDIEQIAFILTTARLKLLVYEPATEPLMSGVLPAEPAVKTLHIGTTGTSGEKPGNCWRVPEEPAFLEDLPIIDSVRFDDPFSLTFTSGTTGTPKGVSHRIRTLLQCAYAFNEAVGFGPHHRFYHILPMGYMAGLLNNLLCPMLAGASVVIDRLFDARMALRFWQTPLKFGVNTMWLVPSILATLLKTDRGHDGEEYCGTKMDFICVGTAPLPTRLKKDFEQRYSTFLLESYGLSETLFVTTNSRRYIQCDGFTGPALKGVDIRIVNEQGGNMPPGVEGDVGIQSRYMFAGYLNDTTGRVDPFPENGWYESGDIGFINEQSHLRITDRKKDLIIRGGLNISPRKIEEVLSSHPAVEESAVIGVPHEQFGEEVVAVIKLRQKSDREIVESELLSECRSRLSHALVPGGFVFLNELPRSSTGKVSKKDLRVMIIKNREKNG
ncbi:MAG: acyl--CoA ligase [Chitinispirillaceae bacterium]|nr:acyl--CoA ligase [Chitinispirillaceae bacterium]